MREPKEYTKENMKQMLEETVQYFRDHPKHPIPDEELDRILVEETTDAKLELYVKLFTAMREEKRAERKMRQENSSK